MYTDYIEDNEENYYADDDNGSSNFDGDKLKKIAFFVLIFVVLILLIILMAKGCSKNKTNKTDSSTAAVSLALWGQESIKVGEDKKINVDVYNSDGGSFSWLSENDDIATVEDGVVHGVSEGEVIITVQYKDNFTGKTYQKECIVTVTNDAPKIESLSLGQEELSVRVGGSLLLQLSVTPVDARTDDIKFESEAPDIVTVDEKGYIKAVGVGTTSIIAKTSDESVTTSIRIIVTETGSIEIKPTSLNLLGLENGLKVGSTAKMREHALPDNATYTLKWASSDPSIATVDEDGVVTGIKAGSCKIIATTQNGISSELDIVVESNSIPVESITINGETSLTMKLGGTKILRYTISPENATNKNVTYTTSNSSVIFIDSGGVIAAVGTGTAMVTITSEDGNKTAILNITVTSSASATSNDEPFGTSTSTTEITSESTTTETGGSSSTSTEENLGSSYSISSSSSSSDSCSVNSFLISSNQSGAVTSNLRFENASAFTSSSPTPGLKVTSYDSCIKSAKYSMWYSSKKEKLNTSGNGNVANNKDLPKLGNTLFLNEGDGYYYIKATITSKNGQIYSKYYYAIVQNGGKTSSSSTSSGTNYNINVTRSGNTFTITKASNSNANKFYYCTTSSTATNCTPILTNSSMNISGSTKLSLNYKTGSLERVCFRGYDSSSKTWGIFSYTSNCLNLTKTSANTSAAAIKITSNGLRSQSGSYTRGDYVRSCNYKLTMSGSVKKIKKAESYKSQADCISKLTSSPTVTSSVSSTTRYYTYNQAKSGGSSTLYLCFAGYDSSDKRVAYDYYSHKITSGSCS